MPGWAPAEARSAADKAGRPPSSAQVRKVGEAWMRISAATVACKPGSTRLELQTIAATLLLEVRLLA